MSGSWKDDYKPLLVGGLSALGGLATLGVLFYIFRGVASGNRWEALGTLATAVVLAFAVAAMLRFALAPLIAPDAPPAAATEADAATRRRIGPLVLLIGSIAIVALATALIVAFVVLALQQGSQSPVGSKVDTLLTGVFSTVLPVVATWVGTVLAFYFGSENFRQAAQSTREAISSQSAARKKITDIMIPYERIGRLGADNEAAAETSLSMLDVVHTLSAAAPRVIVFNPKTQTPIYVIRSDSPPMPPNWVTPDYAAGSALPDNAKLKDYLDYNNGENRNDARKFRFVDVNATPEAAIALMKREGVDDLFITSDGQPTSRVLGWVATQDLLNK